LPSLIKGRPPNNNNKAKCIPGGTLRVLAGKNNHMSPGLIMFDELSAEILPSLIQGRHNNNKM
jgi:hypothetical protein